MTAEPLGTGLVDAARIWAMGAAALLLAVTGSLTVSLAAQTGTPFNERDDQYRLLGLKRAKGAFELARSDYRRAEQLHAGGLQSESELDGARRLLAEAEVNYQQSLLAVVFEQQYVAVTRAVKYQGEDGRKRVRLRLENTSSGGAELAQLVAMEDELFQALKPDVVHDLYASLANDDGAIISQPYEAKLEELRYGRPAELDFAMLQDVDSVTVHLAYGHSSQRSVKIFLQKDASEDKVVVQSEQFSQEVELGASATFDLTLELFSGTTDTFKLAVVNLPQELNRYFVDPSTRARLSQFKFTEAAQTRNAALEVFLPDRASAVIVAGRPIPFDVLVVPRPLAEALGPLEDRSWSPQEIAELGVGHVRLELIPRGVGRLRVRAPQLYFPLNGEGFVEATLEVINEGSRRLDNVEVAADPPLRWEKVVDPPVIATLAVGEERKVRVRLTPPEETPVGKYEVRLRTTSFSDNQPIEGEDKTLTVELQSEVQVAPSVLLVLALVALVLGVVIFGVRLSRR